MRIAVKCIIFYNIIIVVVEKKNRKKKERILIYIYAIFPAAKNPNLIQTYKSDARVFL